MAEVEIWRPRCRAGLCFVYSIAGVLHLLLPAPFIGITPDWVPFPGTVIAFTGCCEIAGAIGLLVPSARKTAGIAFALYAVCVFPANIKHAHDALMMGHPSVWAWLYHMPRLALQPGLVWLALFAGGIAY